MKRRKIRRNPATVPGDVYDQGPPAPYPYPYEDPSLSPEEKTRRWNEINRASEERNRTSSERFWRAKRDYVEIIAEIARQMGVRWQRVGEILSGQMYGRETEFLKLLSAMIRDSYAATFAEFVQEQGLFVPGRTASIHFGTANSYTLQTLQNEYEERAIIFDQWLGEIARYVSSGNTRVRAGFSEPSNRSKVSTSWSNTNKGLAKLQSLLSQGSSASSLLSDMAAIRQDIAIILSEYNYQVVAQALSKATATNLRNLRSWANQSIKQLRKPISRYAEPKAARTQARLIEASDRGEPSLPSEIVYGRSDEYPEVRGTIEFDRKRPDPRRPILLLQQRSSSPLREWSRPFRKIPLSIEPDGSVSGESSYQLQVQAKLDLERFYKLYGGALQRAGVPLTQVFDADTIQWLAQG